MLDRKIRKKIEWAFRNYDTLKEQGADYLVALAEQGITPMYGAVGSRASPGNPTESKGIRAAEYNAVLWCKVVENTLTAFRWEPEYEIIKGKFFNKNYPSDKAIYTSLYIPERTYYYCLDRIYLHAYQWVKEYKL